MVSFNNMTKEIDNKFIACLSLVPVAEKEIYLLPEFRQ